MTVPRTLRATIRSQQWHLSREGPARTPGPSWGRDRTVNNGQSRCPADNHNRSSTAVIGRHGVEGPYMACKGSHRYGEAQLRREPVSRRIRAPTMCTVSQPSSIEGWAAWCASPFALRSADTQSMSSAPCRWSGHRGGQVTPCRGRTWPRDRGVLRVGNLVRARHSRQNPSLTTYQGRTPQRWPSQVPARVPCI
jgi:hypothetical protein